MRAALEAKCGPSFDVGSEGFGKTATIAFQGAFAATNVPTTVCTVVAGPGSCAVTQETDGVETMPTGPLLAGSTADLEVHPDSDGGVPNDGSDEDVLYVLRGTLFANKTVQQFGPANDPGLTAAPTAADDAHGSGAGFDSVSGLGLDSGTGRLFVSGSSAKAGSGPRVFVLDDNVAPSATLDSISTFDAHSATFSGSVNPTGFYTTYRFEYVDDAEFTANGFDNAKQVPLADVALGNGSSSIDVEQDTPHTLTASTTYHVRLLAGQLFSPTATIGGPQTFTTDGAAPSFHAAASVTGADTATLRAAIDPENQAVTNYHFNWGASDSYGSTTTPAALPSGTSPVAVSADLTNLTPGQTYHFQLVATNGTGTTTGPDQTFTVQSPGLGPKRGDEIVSQYPTGGVPLIPKLPEADISPDGEHVVFKMPQPLPGSVTPFPADQISGSPLYRSSRGSDSWDVTPLGLAAPFSLYAAAKPSIDTTRQLVSTEVGVDPDDQNGTWDVYLREPDGSFVWVSRDPRIPVGAPQSAGGAALPGGSGGSGIGIQPQFTMSANGETVVFRSQRQLADADTAKLDGGNKGSLYKWSAGQLSFIGARPDGSVPAAGSSSATDTFNTGYARNAVASNGDRAVWSAQRIDGVGVTPGGPSDQDGWALYVQRDGQPTVEATKETGVARCRQASPTTSPTAAPPMTTRASSTPPTRG